MRRILPLLAATALLAACGADAAEPGPERPTTRLSIETDTGRAALRVAVARTEADRARGLMGVERLPADQGMAFVYEEPVTNRFWMKDTLIPLSIAFWDARGRIVGILDMQPCETDACPTYGPSEPYVGAVEANLGWFEDHGIRVGDRVVLEGAA